MEIVKIDAETQIKILIDARNSLNEGEVSFNCGFFQRGVCYYIYHSLNDMGYININEKPSIKIINSFIDNLTIHNARLLSRKYNFKYPTGSNNYFWWDDFSDWNKVRIQFLDAMITELKMLQ